jgi:glycosyltransferase involved in cell wall biosynthesis
MACGASINSTDRSSGPAEILENGKWGRLVPVAAGNTLTEALLEIMNGDAQCNPEARAEALEVKKIAQEIKKVPGLVR